MNYRRLGHHGLKVSELSYGSWVTFKTQLDVEHAVSMITTAVDAGVNFFDNAEAYAGGDSEVIMGKAIAQMGLKRDTYCVSSKVFWGGSDWPTQQGLSLKHVTDACHAALRRLQVDYLDLYFCHRPDPETPIEETVRAMDTLIRQGKVLYWGTSEWSAQQIMQAVAVARQFNLTPPAMEQPEYNLFHRHRVEREYERLYSEIGLGTTIWSPLASGLLTGKYDKGIPEDSRFNLPGYEWLKKGIESEKGQRRIEKVKHLSEIAAGLGLTTAQLALAWCLKNPNVSTVILGASKPWQLEENLKAADVADKLTDDVMAKIAQCVDG